MYLETAQDTYVRNVISRYKHVSNAWSAQLIFDQLRPTLEAWGGIHLNGISIAGSVAKDTAILGSSDIDIFVSVKSTAREKTREIYDKLHDWMKDHGYVVQKQNVSIGLQLSGKKIDLVPAKQKTGFINEHYLWSDKHTQLRTTNVQYHINHIKNSGRLNEIRAIKIWKKKHELTFPSFLLEMTVITALKGRPIGTNLASNVLIVLEYIRDALPTVRITDPSKITNILSDELTTAEKTQLSRQAGLSRSQSNWESIIA